mgnify:CR=1 FL=1
MIRSSGIYKNIVLFILLFIMLISCKAVDKYPYSKSEMSKLSREELMSISGKTFFIISDSQLGGSITKAQIFTEENQKYKVYLSIQNGTIKMGDGSIFLDIRKFPIEFDSWRIARNSTNTVFLIYPSQNNRETADPIFVTYDMSKDSFEEKTIDPSEY